MAGYFIGGITADRFPNFLFAALIKFVTAAYLLFVHWVAAGALEGFIDLIPDEITALFASGFVVCFPPLLVLGMYSPLAVRLLLGDPSDAGKIAGGLFALSSLGNIAGIIVTTFVLIPSIGTRAITLGFAIFLLATGIVSLTAGLLQRDGPR